MQANHRFIARRGSVLLRFALWGGGGILLLLAILLGVYLFFGWRARLALEKTVATLISAGEPLTIDLLQPPRIDDSQNADADVRAAIALLPGQTEASTNFRELREGPRLPLTDEERVLLRAYLDELSPALQTLHGGLEKPRAVSQNRLTSPLLNARLPQLQPMRELANGCGYRTYLHFDDGRHDLAIESLRPIEPMSRVCGTGPTLVNCLVAMGMRAVAATRLIEIAPELKIGTATGDVTPDNLRRQIEELLDQKSQMEEFRAALQGERLMQLDTMLNLAGGTLSVQQVTGVTGGGAPAAPSSTTAFLARPMLYSNAADCLEMTGDYIKATAAADLPAARAMIDSVERRADALSGRYTKIFASILMPSLGRSFVTHYRVRTDQNLAATALAIRWYQVDHHGALPDTLADLVPRYLPEVPLDYISGRPIRYRSEGEQPIIWSVGDNEIDDEGSSESASRHPATGPYSRWHMKDAVVFLKPQPRATTPPGE